MKLPVAVRGTLLLVLMFAAGVATGIYYERRGERPHQPVPADVHLILHRLSAESALTPAQRETIDQILARHQRDVDSTWRAMRPQVHAALDATVQDIVAVLTPEQAAQFRRLMDSHHGGARH